jgi:hypothetical protein
MTIGSSEAVASAPPPAASSSASFAHADASRLVAARRVISQRLFRVIAVIPVLSWGPRTPAGIRCEVPCAVTENLCIRLHAHKHVGLVTVKCL